MNERCGSHTVEVKNSVESPGYVRQRIVAVPVDAYGLGLAHQMAGTAIERAKIEKDIRLLKLV